MEKIEKFIEDNAILWFTTMIVLFVFVWKAIDLLKEQEKQTTVSAEEFLDKMVEIKLKNDLLESQAVQRKKANAAGKSAKVVAVKATEPEEVETEINED